MERKSKRNRKLFKLIISLLIIGTIITSSLTVLTYFKYKDIKKNYGQMNEEASKKEQELNNLKKEKEGLDIEIKDLSNLDSKIEEEKKAYFANIKKLEDEILSEKSDKKIAYLTFDDGPYYNTYKVLDILDQYNVKATFFTTTTNGEYCFDNKKANCIELYKEYAKRGHTIANHTYTHAIFRGLYSSVDNFMTAVKKQEEHVKEFANGYQTRIVRFPGGSNTAKNLKNGIIEELRKEGYGWVDWTALDGDGGDLSSKEEAWSILKGSIDENIEVILFHDYEPITTNILPEVIEYLRGKGYILLPLFYESNMVNK